MLASINIHVCHKQQHRQRQQQLYQSMIAASIAQFQEVYPIIAISRTNAHRMKRNQRSLAVQALRRDMSYSRSLAKKASLCLDYSPTLWKQ